jgi:hypothetical protein
MRPLVIYGVSVGRSPIADRHLKVDGALRSPARHYSVCAAFTILVVLVTEFIVSSKTDITARQAIT